MMSQLASAACKMAARYTGHMQGSDDIPVHHSFGRMVHLAGGLAQAITFPVNMYQFGNSVALFLGVERCRPSLAQLLRCMVHCAGGLAQAITFPVTMYQFGTPVMLAPGTPQAGWPRRSPSR